MGFETTERSLFGARPVEFYKFEMGPNQWRYTSSTKDLEFKSQTYLSRYVKRGNIKQSKESSGTDDVTLKIGRDLPVLDLFKIIVPSKTIWLTIYENHMGEPDNEASVKWFGRVRGCVREGNLAKLECDALSSIVSRSGLRLNFQGSCNNMLFSSRCRADKAKYRVQGTMHYISGNIVKSSAFASKPSGWFKFGLLEINNYYYMVINHAADWVETLTPVEDAKVGDLILAHAGCDRSLGQCWNKFNNGINFGGFPYTPSKNLFLKGFL